MINTKSKVGRPAKGNTKIMIYLEPKLKELITQQAKLKGLSRSEYVQNLIMEQIRS